MYKNRNADILIELSNLLAKHKNKIAFFNSKDVLTSEQTNLDNVERAIVTLKGYANIEIAKEVDLTGAVAIYSCYGDPSFSIFGLTVAPAITLGGKDAELLIGLPSMLKNYGEFLQNMFKESKILPNLKFIFGTKTFFQECMLEERIKHAVVFGDKWVFGYADKFKHKISLTYYGPGNNTSVILSEEKLEEAVERTLETAFILSGQVAVTINRCIIDSSLDKQKVKFVFEKKLKNITSGKGTENYVTPIIIPPLIGQLSDRIKSIDKNQIDLTNFSVKEEVGGFLVNPSLAWLENTDNELWKEYHFVPVLPIAFVDRKKIAKEVNDTDYGIYTSIWLGENENIEEIENEIKKEHIMLLRNKSILDVLSLEDGYTGGWGGFKNSGFYMGKLSDWKIEEGAFSLLNTFSDKKIQKL
jgi:hypothetical protein